MSEDLTALYFPTERIVFIAQAGTKEKITAYIEQHPGVWNNVSNFIRAAISCYCIEQRRLGRHITERKEV